MKTQGHCNFGKQICDIATNGGFLGQTSIVNVLMALQHQLLVGATNLVLINVFNVGLLFFLQLKPHASISLDKF